MTDPTVDPKQIALDFVKKWGKYFGIIPLAAIAYFVFDTYFATRCRPDKPPVQKPIINVDLKEAGSYLRCIFKQKECVYDSLKLGEVGVLKKCGGRDLCENPE